MNLPSRQGYGHSRIGGCPDGKGANAGLKVASLVGGMVAGADSIDDVGLLRYGGMRKFFTGCYAPAARFLSGLATSSPVVAGIDD